MAQHSAAGPFHVVILGAGVIGLTTAHVLSTRYPSYKLTVIARDLPDEAGLSSQAWASPWAGADWSPIGEYEEQKYRIESRTFDTLWDMIPTGLVKKLPSRICYTEGVDLDKLWYKNLVRDFRILEAEELPSGAAGGVGFTTVSVNPQIYLPWLYNELRARGVQFIRKKVESIAEPAEYLIGKGAVVNATALGARSLIGVQDQDVYPIRGQTILACAPDVQEFLSYPLGLASVPTGQATYMIPRPSPEGHVLIGGTFQEHSWDLSVDWDVASAIWSRCSELAPSLQNEKTRVISHNVGLRPARQGGPRIEAEWFTLPFQSEYLTIRKDESEQRNVLVIHAYGFGAAGYQGSWGAAEEVVEILHRALQSDA